MSGLPHVEKVKSHFISGEPGTTGREPFEESISTGKFLPDHLNTTTGQAPHIPSGTHVGGAPVGAGIDGDRSAHDHGLGASHGTHGTGLDSTRGTHAQTGEKKPLVEKIKEKVGLDKDPAVNSGHNNHSSTAGTGVGSAHGTGSHGVLSTTPGTHALPETRGADAYGTHSTTGTHGAHSTTTGTHSSTGEKKPLVEKIKEKVGLDKDPAVNSGHNNSSSTSHNNHGLATGAGVGAGVGAAGLAGSHAHGDHSSHSTAPLSGAGTNHGQHGISGVGSTGTGTGLGGNHSHGTGIAGANSSNTAGGATYNRDIVDKVNDALPGTPAKAPQAYEAGDRSTGVTGTQYGSGKHAGAGEGIHPGVGGIVSGGHGVAGTAHDGRMVDRAPESLDHQHGATSGLGHNSTTSTGLGHNSNTTTGLGHNSTSTGLGHNNNTTPGLGHNSTSTGLGHNDHSTSTGLGHNNHSSTTSSSTRDEPSKGGLSGVLGTSDKDFLSRDRKGEGAYADTDGVTQLNASGPKGNSALTGREGSVERNPVAQAKGLDHSPSTHADSTTATGTHGEAHGEKKGLLQKIKDIL